jgi:hypothetical protein
MFGRIALGAIALTTVLSGAIGPLDAYAQQSELIPLQQYLDLPADRQVLTYPLVRCAGMHLGLVTYGIANKAPDQGESGVRTAYALLTVASLIRVHNNEGTQEEINQNVADSAKLVSNLYVQRLKDNYARIGQAFGSDPLVLSDLELCKVIAQTVVEKFPELVKAVP